MLAQSRAGAVPEKTWRQRMAQLYAYPSNKAVAQYVAKAIHPALEAVVGEFNELGYEAELTITPNAKTGIDEHTLLVRMHDHRNFHYQVEAMEAPVPAFGARTVSREVDVYYRLEVFTQTGTEGYDLMGPLRGAPVVPAIFLRARLRLVPDSAASGHGHGPAG